MGPDPCIWAVKDRPTYCNTRRKEDPQKVSYCNSTQLDCVPASKTFYTDCGSFNVGCKVFDIVGGDYIPIPDGFYSDGTNAYYVSNGIVSNQGQACPRFFPLQYVKDCLNKDNLTGTYYVTVVDDNTWVPNTNVIYRIPIPVLQTGDCLVQYRSYWAVRFSSTTPVYNIGAANYIEAIKNDVIIEYNTPAFLQDRCSTKSNGNAYSVTYYTTLGTKPSNTNLAYQVYVSTDNGSTFSELTYAMYNYSNCQKFSTVNYYAGTQLVIKVVDFVNQVDVPFNISQSTTCPSNTATYCSYSITVNNNLNLAITVYNTFIGGFGSCAVPPPQ